MLRSCMLILLVVCSMLWGSIVGGVSGQWKGSAKGSDYVGTVSFDLTLSDDGTIIGSVREDGETEKLVGEYDIHGDDISLYLVEEKSNYGTEWQFYGSLDTRVFPMAMAGTVTGGPYGAEEFNIVLKRTKSKVKIAIDGPSQIHAGDFAQYMCVAYYNGQETVLDAEWEIASKGEFAFIYDGELEAGAVEKNQTIKISASYFWFEAPKTATYSVTIVADRPESIDKCNVKAGKKEDSDSFQLSGILNATLADLNGSDSVILSVASDEMLTEDFDFPVDASSLKGDKFSATYPKGNSKPLFKYDPKNGKMSFDVKNMDLKGMSCPITVTITIGEYLGQFILDEDVVNGPKQPCPPQLIMGVEDSLAVLKSKVKYGKKEWTDSFAVSGYFTIDGDRDIDEGIVIELGEQAFTISGDKFTEKKNIVSCKKAVSEEGPLVDAKFDFDKCTFLITVKNAEIESGVVEFDIECFGHDLPEQDVEI